MTLSPLLFGIKNCDQVKKAQKWLRDNKIEYVFIDYVQHSFDDEWYHAVISHVGQDKLLNKKSLTWRQLPPQEQALSETTEGLLVLLRKEPKLMKRPILVLQDQMKQTQIISVGFDENKYRLIFHPNDTEI